MYTRQDYLNHKCTHREYFAQFVNGLHKRIVLERWTTKELARAWENDEAFNTRVTSISQWGRLPCPTDHRLLDAVGEHSTPSTRVCILKEAARQIVEDHYKEFGRLYDKFGYDIIYTKADPADCNGYHASVEAPDVYSAQKMFEKRNPGAMFLSATKYGKHNSLTDSWEMVTKD